MPITDEQIEDFRKKMEAEFGEPMSFDDAKVRYYQLLDLYWICAHKPPEPGEAPYEPPLPPWRSAPWGEL